jgi:hypothetical protein
MKPMTDNLKTRIAEAIAGDGWDVNYQDECAAQRILDIVEPMLNGLQGVIDSQQWTNQALIKRIPKWMPIESAPKDGTEILWLSKHSKKQCVASYPIYSECFDNPDDLWQPLPTAPEKE